MTNSMAGSSLLWARLFIHDDSMENSTARESKKQGKRIDIERRAHTMILFAQLQNTFMFTRYKTSFCSHVLSTSLHVSYSHTFLYEA